MSTESAERNMESSTKGNTKSIIRNIRNLVGAVTAEINVRPV